ncbi:MAG: DUF5011 domain-containing protein [Clostridia bacterium]|nr:DUF5011 domain-containing protein [Clostridia bacterium]
MNDNIKNTKTKNNTKKNGKKKEKFSQKHPRISITIKIVILIILMAAVVGAGVVVGMLYGAWGQEFEISEDELIINGNSVVVDSKGKVIAELSGDENRKVITLKDMPENLIKAYVSIEDERYYQHSGVDFKRTSAAIATYVFHRGNSSFGGSTITQQLVKNITQDKEDTGMAGVTRKVKEWAKAYQIERMLSKDQILELYLNIIFVGGDNYGVEAGAKYYFNKSASKLNLAECAFLAGINNAPNTYNPYGDYKYGKDQNRTDKINNRTKTVLSKMLEQKYINQEDYDEACGKVDKGLKFKQANRTTKKHSYHTEAAIAQAINDIMEEKNWSKEYTTTYVYGGGLTIHSTQDSDVQNDMIQIMDKNSSKYITKSRKTKDEDGKYVTSQAAMVVIDNETGYVAGCVGELGEKSATRGLNRATQSARQTGSSIKPIADLLPGIEEGIITPATVYYDNSTEFTGSYTSGSYKPKNQSKFRGSINLRQAVTTSQNIPFVKVMAELTPPVSREYMRKMGITTLDDKQDNGLSLAIGGLYIGISPLEMAAAYATIANDGVYREPLFYTRIEDSDGKIVLEAKQETNEVCSKQTAYILKNMLTSVVKDSGATAPYCAISGIDVAAKTGTTNSDYDRWLCGFTNYYSGATWYGFDQNEEVNYPGNPAGQIWSAVMKLLHKDKAKSKFEQPDGIVKVKVCNSTGLKATGKCGKTHYEIFAKGKEPETCNESSRGVKVCEDTDLLANEYCPNTVTKYAEAKAPKENLDLWKTKGYSSKTKLPSKTCTEHNKDNTTSNGGLKPKIKLKGSSSMTINVGDTYTEKGATASDKEDGDITDKIKISGSVNTSKAGTYKVVYTVTNSKDKTTTVTRTIIVKEKSTPSDNTPGNGNSNDDNPSTNATTPGDTVTTNPEPKDNGTAENKQS